MVHPIHPFRGISSRGMLMEIKRRAPSTEEQKKCPETLSLKRNKRKKARHFVFNVQLARSMLKRTPSSRPKRAIVKRLTGNLTASLLSFQAALGRYRKAGQERGESLLSIRLRLPS
jgi:hypothetical protein